MTPYYTICHAFSGDNQTQQRIWTLCRPRLARFLAPCYLVSFCIFIISFREPAGETKRNRGFDIFNNKPVKWDGTGEYKHDKTVTC
jgi:hypothetical protein